MKYTSQLTVGRVHVHINGHKEPELESRATPIIHFKTLRWDLILHDTTFVAVHAKKGWAPIVAKVKVHKKKLD